ncbi:hypothetical protein M1145_01875, partial [Patescibacteria group bacterium]|nr:hypothetical protein [Patescibacteria group bacterium]
PRSNINIEPVDVIIEDKILDDEGNIVEEADTIPEDVIIEERELIDENIISSVVPSQKVEEEA